MARKLASIQKILDIQPIENADKIELATVLGWHVVVSKSENHKIGDLVCYVEIDSQCPETPLFEFLKERKYRVKTIKLRGQISQGLIIPLDKLPKGNYKEGQDVTKILGITKYDPEAEKENKLIEQSMKNNKKPIHKKLMKYKWYRKLYSKFTTPTKSGFPTWIKKTDEDRIQVLVEKFNDIIAVNDTKKALYFDSTEKLDGQSATYFIKKYKKLGLFTKYDFGVCSRNLRLKTPSNSSYWTIAKKHDMEGILKDMIKKYNANSIVIQGEICGTGIQGNKYQIDGYKLFVFNLIIDNKRYRTQEVKNILKPYKIETVPILDTNVLLLPSIDEMVKNAEGKSKIYSKSDREGKVWRSCIGDLSFKVINPKFLLKNNE